MGNTVKGAKKLAARSGTGSKLGSDEVPKLPRGKTLFFDAIRAEDQAMVDIRLEMEEELGRGAFGAVFRMLVREVEEDDDEEEAENDEDMQGKEAAVKIPGQDGSLAEIECYVLEKIRHPSVVTLLYYFTGYRGSDNVSLVLELVKGSDLFHYMKRNFNAKRGLGMMLELFSYQLFRALGYIHSLNIAHRDIKPENALVNPETGVLKLADFGCAAEFDEDKAHSFYIGTRIFRAPELLLGARKYSTQVDVWSGGVLVSEMALGVPVFYGQRGQKGHLLNIFQYCGLPTDQDFQDMNLKKIPMPRSIQERTFEERLQRAPPTSGSKEDLLELFEDVLVLSPTERLTAWEVCNHEFFDALDTHASLINGRPLPPLYNFSQGEINSMPPHVKENLGAKMES